MHAKLAHLTSLAPHALPPLFLKASLAVVPTEVIGAIPSRLDWMVSRVLARTQMRIQIVRNDDGQRKLRGMVIALITKFADEFGHDLSLSGTAEVM